MKFLLIVPLIGIVFAAPVAENDKSIRPIVKRAMETIMFGNQQNSAKHVKKSDPSIPLRDDLPDVKGPVLPDEGGVVEASEPKDIPKTEEVSEENLKEELKEKDKEESVVESKDESGDSEEPEIVNKDQSSEGQSSEETDIPKEDAEAIEELEDSVRNGKPENTEVQSTDGAYEDPNYESPYDIYELYKQYQNMLSQYPRTGMGMDYYDLLHRRRRAIRKRKYMGKMLKERAVKRRHRNKRDLAYPDDLYYYTPEDEDLNELYSGYDDAISPYSQSTFDELLDILRKNRYESEYESPYGYYNVPEDEYEDVMRPSKRQMLSFVPGNRKRFFYPVNDEPQTHFGAFVPQKRDYFDTYGSLVRAARQLAARQEEQDGYQGYPEWY